MKFRLIDVFFPSFFELLKCDINLPFIDVERLFAEETRKLAGRFQVTQMVLFKLINYCSIIALDVDVLI